MVKAEAEVKNKLAVLLALLAKYTSRKFLVTLAAEVGALVALFAAPETGNAVQDAILRIGALVAAVIVAIGYVATEGRVDEAALKKGREPRMGFYSKKGEK